MRYVLVMLSMLFWTVTSALAQVSVGVGIGLPGVSIGINVPAYPELVVVPGYPVYYAPRLRSNYFFYDGMYWVYVDDNWYASSWYNGPWALVGPEFVPLFILRIPVRYYSAPPAYFGGWQRDAAPRWGEHWGNQWEQRRSGWDRWNRNSAPARAPLPVYQRQYSGDRYPRAVEQQQALVGQRYRYQPRDTVVRQYYQEQAVQRAPAPSQRGQQEAPRERSSRQQEQRSSPQAPLQQQAPAQASPQQRGAAVQEQRQQPQQGAAPRAPRSSQENIPQSKAASQDARRGQGHEKDRDSSKASQAPRRGQKAEKDGDKSEERGKERK